MADKQRKDERLALRISARQKQLIERAAEAADKDLSSFVLEPALAYAHRVLEDRRTFLLDDKSWAGFNEMLDRPTTPLRAKQELEGLLKKPSALERKRG